MSKSIIPRIRLSEDKNQMAYTTDDDGIKALEVGIHALVAIFIVSIVFYFIINGLLTYFFRKQTSGAGASCESSSRYMIALLALVFSWVPMLGPIAPLVLIILLVIGICPKTA